MVYLIGVDHIQDVIDSLGYAWADQALLEVVNRFREKLKPDQYLCRIEGTQFVLVSPKTTSVTLPRSPMGYGMWSASR